MQALGAYAFLGLRRGKPAFLAHIPAALRLLEETLAPLAGGGAAARRPRRRGAPPPEGRRHGRESGAVVTTRSAAPPRAMVLAAGLGTRLRPLTNLVPKPLVPVANRPLLEYTFALLAAAGVREAIVNAHHLADELERGLRALDAAGIALHVSRERRILGTAGGLKRAEAFLGGGTFLLLNGDFLVDLDLRQVLEFHSQQHATATMVLLPDENSACSASTPTA